MNKMNPQKHMEVCQKLNQIFTAKNKDYGNNFEKQWDEFGELTGIIRADDKIQRIKQLYKNKINEVKDESALDSWYDLANYAILNILMIEGDNNTETTGENTYETTRPSI